MKAYFLFILGILVIPACNNEENKTAEKSETKEVTAPENKNSTSVISGQWKKIAAGQDDNKNRVLDEAEIIKPAEPSLYDNLDFKTGDRCHINGMGMDINGS